MKPNSVTPSPPRNKKTHEAKQVFRSFNRHVWAFYPISGWTYLDPASITGWPDLFFGRIRAAYSEVCRKFQPPSANPVTHLDEWLTVLECFEKLESARTFEGDTFFARWWCDKLIETVGFQLWNHIWDFIYSQTRDTRKADKAADEYIGRFEKQFI